MVGLKVTAVVVIYIYTYIYIYIPIYIYKYIYTYIYAHSCLRLIVVSVYILCCQTGFQVLRDFSTPDCFVVCLCLIRLGVLARACAYICVGRIYLCMCIYLRIHIQRLYVCVYICVYVQILHVGVYRFTYMDTKVACVCTYLYVYHTEFRCAYMYTNLTCVFLHFAV